MLTINVISQDGNKLLTGTIDGAKFNVPYEKKTHKALEAKIKKYESIEDAEAYDVWVKEVEALLEENDQDIIVTSCPDLVKDPKTGFYYVMAVIDGEEMMTNVPVPNKLISVILESADKSIDPTPIIKAWIRFLRNPNFTAEKAILFADYITAEIVDGDEADRLMKEEGFSEEMAQARATYNDVAITQEGLVVTKKYATLLTEGWSIDPETNKAVKGNLYKKEDDTIDVQTGKITKGDTIFPEFAEELLFEPPVMGTSGDKFFSGDIKGHKIYVGQNHTLEKWSQVDTNDHRTCVKGLHVGGWKYVSSYSHLNTQLLECFVDPSEIGAICGLFPGSDGALRVREYFVFGAVEGRTKGIYHSSKYAALKDAQWEEFKKEAIVNANKLAQGIVDAATTIGS